METADKHVFLYVKTSWSSLDVGKFYSRVRAYLKLCSFLSTKQGMHILHFQ